MNDEIKLVLGEFCFTWDDNKAKANVRKHKVLFEVAAEVFLDKYAVDFPDELHSEDEDRYKIIGRTRNKTLILSVIYVERNGVDNVELYRIISAREADREEKKFYGLELPGRLPAKQRRSNSPYDDNQRRRY